MFAVKRYAGDARPCHRRHLRRRRTLKVSHPLDACGVRWFCPQSDRLDCKIRSLSFSGHEQAISPRSG